MKNLVNRIEQLQEEIVKKEKEHNDKFFITEMKKIGIEKLPYAQNSLKKFIDPETMNVHYNKHYKGYVEKLNLALEKEKFGDLDLEHIVKTISRFDENIRNNAGGAYNHALFWKMLSPTPQKPKELVSQRIIKDFESFPKFKKKFEEVAKERFGSGWVWLVVTKENKFKIMSTPNQDNPLMNDIKNGGYPILGLDLWEHAYYLKYHNKRDEYIKRFWDVVNWGFVEKLYKMKLETKIQEGTVMTQLMLDSGELLSEAVTQSESCSYDEQKQFKNLLFPSSQDMKNSKLYSEFKYTYVSHWNNLLKTLYPNNWREENELFKGHLPGLYDAENKRSLLNNLTSSYTVFCVLHKDVNRYLLKTNQTPIEYRDDPSKNLEELNRFFSVIDGIKERLFNIKTSNTFKSLEKIVKKTDCIGKRSEDAAKKIINAMWEGATCEILAGGGLTADMNSGIDAKVIKDGTDKTGQIKPFKTKTDIVDSFVIGGTSSAKAYSKVDLLIFVNTANKKVLVFNTGNVTTKGNEFIIPKEDFVIELNGDKTIELIDCSEYL
jgi:Fe-Mn family superoxide dismutase